MFVVKPCISVESSPGPISQSLCGVPAFWFSRTMGFGFETDVVVAADPAIAGAAVAGARAPVARAVISGAIRLVVGSVMVFAIELNARLTLLGIGEIPGMTSLKSSCELCATPLGFIRHPAACAGVRL
jgi:hypothetical protein